MKKILSIILITGLAIAAPAAYAQVSVGLSITAGIAPPEIPVYEQPVCPADGYIWTPGYWAYGDDGYYWVPGVWVAPPSYGLLWTPAWWGFDGGVYAFHAGYWGSHVGYYGGINYGFGYGGSGYYGGRWSGHRFEYNSSVTRINRTIVHNTYVNNSFARNSSRASFNGRGGVTARPSRQEEAAMHERHVNPTSNQLAHQRNAGHDRSQFASVNHGRPITTAMNRVNGRKFNQQGRIANGAASGRLNAHETQNLEKREGNINKTVHNQRAANGGRLNAQQRASINTRQNRVSRSINADKHNANNAMAQRRATQEQRAARTNNMRQQNVQRSAQRANMNAQRQANRTANMERAQSRNAARMSAPRQAPQRQMNRPQQMRPQGGGGGRQMQHEGGGGGGGHHR